MQAYELKQQFPFVVRRLADRKILGSTRFYDIHSEHCRMTIGYTWYIPEVWGSYVNPTCKYLLLKYAFEETGSNRIEFQVDVRHAHSRAAVKKLGAKEEGILRQHMVLEDGFIRDTAIYSIVKSDWPEVQLSLQARL